MSFTQCLTYYMICKFLSSYLRKTPGQGCYGDLKKQLNQKNCLSSDLQQQSSKYSSGYFSLLSFLLLWPPWDSLHLALRQERVFDRFGCSQEYGLKEKQVLAKGRLQVTNSPVYSQSCIWMRGLEALFPFSNYSYLESILNK